MPDEEEGQMKKKKNPGNPVPAGGKKKTPRTKDGRPCVRIYYQGLLSTSMSGYDEGNRHCTRRGGMISQNGWKVRN